jgi:hypothetical protein
MPVDSLKRAGVGRLLVKAMSGNINLAVMGAATLGAAIFHSWPILVLGAAAYSALVAWDMVNPEFRQKALPQNKDTLIPLPDIKKLISPEAKELIGRIYIAREERHSILQEIPSHMQNYMQLALASLPELERHLINLVNQCEALTRYLSKYNKNQLESDIQRLEEQARNAGNSDTREQLLSARATRLEQVQAVTDIIHARQRVVASLERISATLEAIPARIVRMRAMDDKAMDSMSGDLNGEIDRMNEEVRAFEETLQPIREVRLLQ